MEWLIRAYVFSVLIAVVTLIAVMILYLLSVHTTASIWIYLSQNVAVLGALTLLGFIVHERHKSG